MDPTQKSIKVWFTPSQPSQKDVTVERGLRVKRDVEQRDVYHECRNLSNRPYISMLFFIDM
jgi:hypothetical protein